MKTRLFLLIALMMVTSVAMGQAVKRRQRGVQQTTTTSSQQPVQAQQQSVQAQQPTSNTPPPSSAGEIEKQEQYDQYIAAAKAGDAVAEERVANSHKFPSKGYLYWLTRSAEHGYQGAQNVLAYCYSNGYGVEKDKNKAFYWWLKSAEGGNTASQRSVAGMYRDGNGTEKNASKAAYWYEKAANQGDVESQKTIGYMYVIGEGVDKDPSKAIYWLKKAADQGNVGAMANLGFIYSNDVYGAELDYPQAINWFEKALINGDKDEDGSIKHTLAELKKEIKLPEVPQDGRYPLKETADYSILVQNGKMGVVSKTGETVLPLGSYERIEEMLEERYVEVAKNGRWGVYDLVAHREIVPCKYDLGSFLIEGTTLCQVAKWGQGGVYDYGKQKEVIPCRYLDFMQFNDEDTEWFKKGIWIVRKNGGRGNKFSGLYDINQQKEITPIKYGHLDFFGFQTKDYVMIGKNFEQGRGWTDDDAVGLLGRDGKEILEMKYTYLVQLDSADRRSNIYVIGEGGRFKTKEDKFWEQAPSSARYALFDAGKRVFMTGFDYKMINYVADGLAAFCTNSNKWGYMDATGKIVVPAEYEQVTDFSDGVAQVTKNGVTSLLTNPLKGTSLKVAGGASLGKGVDTDIPQTTKSDENLFAFIFANENYTHLNGADFAINDGKVFAEYCKKTIGVPEKNVRYFEDATYGNIVSAMKKMKDIAEVYEGEAKIIFYFAGLGATDNQTKERYLLPSDASLATLGSTGYQVSELQKTLNGMNTAYTLAILDAPFSNTDRNGKMLAEARGVQIAPKQLTAQGKTIICMSSMDDETAYASQDYGHGLFTFGILQQLQQTKGEITAKALIDNASKWTCKEVLKRYDQMQTPQQSVSMDMEEKWQNLKF